MSSSPERHWSKIALPAEVTRVPAMLSLEERQYLYWVTRHAFEGWGRVVDLGPWIGGSSVALAAGLRDRGSSATVRSFDLFEWSRQYMEDYLPTGLSEGADFMHVFHEQTAPFAQWIEADKMDLLAGEWDGAPIEVLFVDAAKSWDLLDAILRTFGPSLREGRSRVILQDFRHCLATWLPLTFDSRPDLWSQLEAVELGETVTFVPQRSLASDAGMPVMRADDFSLEQVDEIFGRRVESEARTDNRVRFQLGWMNEAIRRGDDVRAAELRRAIRAANGDSAFASNFDAVEMDIARHAQPSHPEAARLIVMRRLTEDADDHAATRLLGFTALQLGDADQARRAWERALELQPIDPELHLQLAKMHLTANAPAEASKHAVDALSQLNGSSEPSMLRWAFLSLGESWVQAGEWPADLGADLKARFAQVSDFHVLCAAVDRHHGRFGDSRQSLHQALELAPDNERAKEMLASIVGTT